MRGLKRHLDTMKAGASHIPGGRTTSLMELLRSNSDDQWLAAMLATALEVGNYDDAAYIFRHGFGVDVTAEQVEEAARFFLDTYRENGPTPGDSYSEDLCPLLTIDAQSAARIDLSPILQTHKHEWAALSNSLGRHL
ncbi:MAG: hypothetical protein JXA87_15380 [Thermoleophilia bacterium]|nr:hypothetical protein [Thermoleophilia bacterium]